MNNFVEKQVKVVRWFVENIESLVEDNKMPATMNDSISAVMKIMPDHSDWVRRAQEVQRRIKEIQMDNRRTYRELSFYIKKKYVWRDDNK